jgi:cell wall-associated NlpC family hydrolase
MVYFCSSALAAGYACRINTSTKVYKRASTSSASMKVGKNTKCTMKGVKGSWAQIERSGTSAYIPVKYLTLTDRITAYASKSTTMYKRASASSSKLGTLAKGTTVYINGRDGSFFRCQNKSGSVTGYVKMSHLTEKKPSSSSVSSSAGSSSSSTSSSSGKTGKVETAIKMAESLLGKPYDSDANPPKSFDCSRFVRYCYDQADVSLSASAKSQGYDSRYERVASVSALKRGDVVVFNTNASDSDLSDHTGIYLGSGHFIHASSSAGKVIKSSLSSGYYERTFSWGLRIVK